MPSATVGGLRMYYEWHGHGYFWEVPQAFNAACLAFLAAQKSA